MRPPRRFWSVFLPPSPFWAEAEPEAEPPDAPAPPPPAAAEIAPGLRDGVQVLLDPGRGHHVLVDQAEVVGHRPDPVGERLVLARVLAEVARADRGGLLADVHRVALAEDGEDGVGVVGGRGQPLVLLRVVAVHDGRPCAAGGVVDRVRVREPGAAPGQLGEAGEALRVDLALGVHDRDAGELVEPEEHDRRVRSALDVLGLGVTRGDDVRHGRHEQEQDQQEQGRRREHAQEGAHGLGARVAEGQQGPDAQRQHQQHQRAAEGVLEELDHTQGGQQRHEHQVHHLTCGLGHQTDQELDQDADQRRAHHHEKGEHDDVARAGAARGEELGVLAQDVEQRLAQRERGQHRQVQEGPGQRRGLESLARLLWSLGCVRGGGLPAAHQPSVAVRSIGEPLPLGRAKYSSRVPDARRSRRSTSNAPASTRSKFPRS